MWGDGWQERWRSVVGSRHAGRLVWGRNNHCCKGKFRGMRNRCGMLLAQHVWVVTVSHAWWLGRCTGAAAAGCMSRRSSAAASGAHLVERGGWAALDPAGRGDNIHIVVHAGLQGGSLENHGWEAAAPPAVCRTTWGVCCNTPPPAALAQASVLAQTTRDPHCHHVCAFSCKNK